MAEERPRRAAASDPEKEAQRKRLIEEAKARWAAKKAEGGGATAPAAPRAAETKPASQAPSVPAPVAAANPGGSPLTPPANPNLVVAGTVNQAVEVQAHPSEEANLRKLLGGLGAYPNPLRRGAWQVDYRYWQEAQRRLSQAGYKLEARDYLGRPLDEWDPVTRGWARAEPV